MRKLIEKWLGVNLVVRIVGALIFGTLAGIFFPSAGFLAVFGNIFVGLMKAVAPVLVFFMVCASVSQSSKAVGSRFKTVIFLYIVSMSLAATVSTLGSFLFRLKISFLSSCVQSLPKSTPSNLNGIFLNFFDSMIQNPLISIANGNYLGILFWAIVFGFGMKLVGRRTAIQLSSDISTVTLKIIQGIIQLAPFGIFGLVYKSICESGISIFRDYGQLLALLVGCMLFSALVINPAIVGCVLRKNPYPLILKCLKSSGIPAFFTRSSAANIPVNMQLCQELGLDKDFYSVSIPLGATVNMSGAAVTITVMTLSVCHTLGVSVDVFSALILSLVATLGAAGTSGMAGGSLLLIPMACSLFGIGNDVAMQAVGVGFVIGVIQDSFETALNSSSDVVFSATAEFLERKK